MISEIPKIASPKQPPVGASRQARRPSAGEPVEPVEPRGDYIDRKRTLPARVGVLGLRLAQLQPGRYVLIIQVAPDGRLSWEEAVVKG